MKFSELKRHITQAMAQKKFSPCYLAAGDDAYLVAKAEELFLAAIEVKELNVSVIPDSAGKEDLYGALNTLPFMSEYRLLILDAKRYNELKDYLKNPQPCVIVLLKGGPALSMAGTELVDCSRLTATELTRSCVYECEKNGVTIYADAAELLAEYCGRFMGRVKNELYKLMDCGQSVITAETVKTLVQPEAEYKVFELTDAIVKKDGFKALSILDDMLSEGYGAAPKVFGLLYSHFRRLFAAALSPDDQNLKDYLDVKEFAVTMAARQAKMFSKLKLKRITDSLHKLDFNIKTGKINDKQGLQTFVLEALSEVN